MSKSAIYKSQDGVVQMDTLRKFTEKVIKDMVKRKEVMCGWIRRLQDLNAFNIKIAGQQITEWKKIGCYVLECNVFPITIGSILTHMVIVQDKNMSEMFDPLALAFGVMVSGFAYICINGFEKTILREIGKPDEESDDNSEEFIQVHNGDEYKVSSVKFCFNCGSRENLKKCSKCQNTYYCSKECQVSDWKEHKKTCCK